MFSFFKRQQSIPCYHCGEPVGSLHAVRLKFHGATRVLCCHGCEAVLMMIESNGLTDDYLRSKTAAETSP